MHSAKSTTNRFTRISVIISAVLISSSAIAQENSPYSRYGMGDVVPNQNAVNRGMGGISAGYSDFQSINFVNPASLGNLRSTVFDLGGEIDIRNLRSNTSPAKSQSVNPIISYIQLGVPLSSEKMMKKNNYWGLSFGLRPVTRINYKVETNSRPNGLDSLSTLYEGNGGITQANISTGIKLKNFSFGVSTGYSFGFKDYSTKLAFINDTTNYYSSNTATQTRFGGVFLNAGIQYDIITKNKSLIRLGAYTNLQKNLSASRDHLNELVAYDISGAVINIDTVSFTGGIKGKVKLPATYGVGFTYANQQLLFGADVEMTQWEDYRFYGEKDLVQNSMTFRAGAQYYPAKDNTPPSKYWSFVKYRAGVYYGKDYIKLDNVDRPNYGVTFGAGLPLTSLQRLTYYREVVLLNLGVEVGGRGNKQSQSLRENMVRFSIGVSMNARWFVKPKYD